MNAVTALPAGAWVLHDAPRITPLPVSRRSRLTRTALAYIRRRAAADDDFNVFTTFARMRSYMPVHAWLVGRLLEDNNLPAADKEQVILRVAWRLGCVYEYAHHHHIARARGVAEDVIVRIASPDVVGLDERLTAMLALTDELVDTRMVSDPTWAAIRQFLSEDEALELCFLVGHYVMVAMTINATGIQVEPSILAALDTERS